MVIFADIEVAVAEHLGAVLDDRDAAAPVVIGVPSVRPKRFVRVVRVGGSQTNLITDRPRIVAECWDTTGVGAAELGALVRAIVTTMAPGYVSGIWVNKVVDMGLSFSPDPDTNLPRYLVPAELYVNGAEL